MKKYILSFAIAAGVLLFAMPSSSQAFDGFQMHHHHHHHHHHHW